MARPSRPPIPRPKGMQQRAPPAVTGSASFAEREKRERSILEGAATSSPSSEAPAHPDTRKSPTAELGFGLGDGEREACGVFPDQGRLLGGR